MKITAKRLDYFNEHQQKLTNTRIVPLAPYTAQDLHDQFRTANNTICQFGLQLIKDGHLTQQQYMDMNFRWNPIKKKVKGSATKQRVHYCLKRDRLRHMDNTIYTVRDIIEMLANKVDQYITDKPTELENFTEAMYHRTNRALNWFVLLSQKYYGQQNGWQQAIENVKIKIQWSKK